jgi:four helix bundle protein
MFDHEKLDVYRTSLEFVTWAFQLSKDLKGMDRAARDQLLRASQSITLNIAEGNGRRPSPDRKRFLQIAYGSAVECAAIIDVLQSCKTINEEQGLPGKALLKRIVSMLIKMIGTYDSVYEEEGKYGSANEKAEYE